MVRNIENEKVVTKILVIPILIPSDFTLLYM